MSDKYIVTKSWGKRKVGDILPDSREVRRKIDEGGCVEKLTDKLLKEKKDAKIKKNKEFKKMQEPVKNKMEPDTVENKGVK